MRLIADRTVKTEHNAEAMFISERIFIEKLGKKDGYNNDDRTGIGQRQSG